MPENDDGKMDSGLESESPSIANVLKRKNEDQESIDTTQLNKRKALVNEQADPSVDPQEPERNSTEASAPANPIISSSSQQETSDRSLCSPSSPNDQKSQLPGKDSSLNPPVDASHEPLSSTPQLPAHHLLERDLDPTYVLFRMYCPVKEASIAVGKKGDTINHLREKANVRIDVSENLKNVPERIVTVRGSAENVARAFGLLVRVILEEPEEDPALENSKAFNMKILVPHPLIGFIIGKQGAKFREIEDKSAAKLKAAEVPLPYLTDRVLSIVGVADAIHIAIFYISQVVLEYKDCLKKNKIVFYNPQNFTAQSMGMPGQQLAPNTLALPHHMQTMQLHLPMHHSNMIVPPDQPMPYTQIRYGVPSKLSYEYPPLYAATNAAAVYRRLPVVVGPKPADQYTDEFGNNIVGDVVVGQPVKVLSHTERYNQDVFVAGRAIGLVIGKRGNNIKHIREQSGCIYVKIEPDAGQSLMLGNGRGLTPVRKLILTGSISSCQAATFLINQRIVLDKERNEK